MTLTFIMLALLVAGAACLVIQKTDGREVQSG